MSDDAQFRSCLAVLAAYLAAVTLAALTALGAQFAGWSLSQFQVDALYDIAAFHGVGLLIVVTLFFATRRIERFPLWGGKVVLAALPVVLTVSCDRLALLVFPPAPREPSTVLFSAHPTRRWTLRPRAEWPTMHIRLNERGTRGPVTPYAKANDEKRVVIVGDSVAFGVGVPYEEVFDRIAVRRIGRTGTSNVSIVNLSVPGYAPWQQVDLLQSDGMAYEPDVIVYAFCLNDVSAWHWRDVPLGGPIRFRYDLFEESGLLRLARGIQHAWRLSRANADYVRERYSIFDVLNDIDTVGVNESWDTMLAHVDEMARIAQGANSRFAIIMFPLGSQLRGEANNVPRPQRRLAAYAERSGIPCLDLLDIFGDARRDEGNGATRFFFDGWHLKSHGHDVAGGAFADFLERVLSEPQ